MKKTFVIITVLLLGIKSYAQDQLVVDPNAEMRTIAGSFNAIIISGGIDLYLTQSESEAVAVSAADEKDKSGIKTIVEFNTLRISFAGGKGFRMKNRQIKVYVSFKTLESLSASGASDVIVAGKIAAKQLKMKFSGASDFKGVVAVNVLVMDLSGASGIHISGNAANVSIQSSGASDVNGFGLVTDICEANASGASDIDITVNKELTARASGASEISFRGSATLKEVHKSGASSVEKRG